LSADPAVERLALGCVLPGVTGADVPEWTRRAAERGLAGVALYGSNAVATGGRLERLAQPLRSLRDDFLVAVDEEGGDVTRLHYGTGSPVPGNLALGVVDDVELTARVARAIASELAEAGINLDFAPSVDVNTDPENPVIGTRSFGSDPELVARHGRAFVEALQSCRVAACAKHFPGHGATHTDSHEGLPRIDGELESLRARELPPFVAAIEAGVAAVMTAHIVFPALDERPATLSRRILTDLLRGELGYEGVVITDALEMKAISSTRGIGRAAVEALSAGADTVLTGNRDGEDDCAEIVDAVRAALAAGELEPARLEQAAERMRRLGAWAAEPRPAEDDAEQIGLAAARRAIRVEGRLPLGRAPFVVHLRDASNLAVGDAHWSLADALAELDFLAGSADVTSADGSEPLSQAPLVVATRNAYRSEWQRAWLARHADAIVVAFGMPDDRALANGAYVLAHGAGRSNVRAAAEALRE
jgi:beta-N-acetylhexosaminidase